MRYRRNTHTRMQRKGSHSCCCSTAPTNKKKNLLPFQNLLVVAYVSCYVMTYLKVTMINSSTSSSVVIFLTWNSVFNANYEATNFNEIRMQVFVFSFYLDVIELTWDSPQERSGLSFLSECYWRKQRDHNWQTMQVQSNSRRNSISRNVVSFTSFYNEPSSQWNCVSCCVADTPEWNSKKNNLGLFLLWRHHFSSHGVGNSQGYSLIEPVVSISRGEASRLSQARTSARITDNIAHALVRPKSFT